MIKDFHKDAIITNDRTVSYSELLQRITLFSRQIPNETELETMRPVEDRAKILIYSENREGFIYAFFSVWLNRCIAIPVDAQANESELIYILKDCQPSAVWTTIERLPLITSAIKNAGMDIPVQIIDNWERKTLRDNTPKADIQYLPEHTALIIYTSGTTGNPKGVMLSFKNLFTNIRSVSEEVPIYTPDRRALILLPLHHVLPLQGTMIAPIVLGAGVAIATSMAGPDIMQTLQKGKVGLFIGVPRLWQTLYNGIMKKINASPVTRGLYKMCEKVDNPAFSRVVFKKIHTMMGGHLEACPSGGAALDPAVWKGLRTLGIEIIDGYGMTECAPIITFSRPDDLQPNCVGKPLPSCQVEIIDGEICAKGDNIMQGYYKRPEETAQVIDKNGWLHSGDLGYFDAEGRLHITGRKKEIIVLSNGKNINPNELESHLEADTLRVKEAAVVEDNNTLKAIICPQPKWAAGKTVQELESLLKQEVIEVYNKTVASYKKLLGVYIYDGELPRTRMDKIQRFKLTAVLEKCRRLRSGETSQEESSPAPTTEEYRLVCDYIRKEKKQEAHQFDNLVSDLGFDSLDLVEFECFLEQTFGIEIPQAKIASFSNLKELSEFISHNKTRIWLDDTNWRDKLTQSIPGYTPPGMARTGWWILNSLHPFCRSHFNLKLYGLENIPKDGQFIMVANHQSYLDTVFLMDGLNRNQFLNMCFFAKEDHVRNPLAKFMARHHGVIVLKRSEMKQSILHLGEALRQGRNVLIFPEGTRTNNGQLGEFRPTFAILSLALGIPVLPVCIEGAFEAMPKHQKIPSRKPVKVTYFPLLMPSVFKNEEDMAEKVKCTIQDYI